VLNASELSKELDKLAAQIDLLTHRVDSLVLRSALEGYRRVAVEQASLIARAARRIENGEEVVAGDLEGKPHLRAENEEHKRLYKRVISLLDEPLPPDDPNGELVRRADEIAEWYRDYARAVAGGRKEL
jgi:hypothetical protein